MKNIEKFLEAGNKVKCTIRFRGREMVHQNLGMELLRKVEAKLVDIGKVEQRARMEGRQMSMVVAPVVGGKKG